MDNGGGSEPCWKSTGKVWAHIITTNTVTTKACRGVFKIQTGPLNCISERTTEAFSFTLYSRFSHWGIDNWEVTLFEKCKTHKQGDV